MAEPFAKPKPTLEQVESWLTGHHGREIEELEPVTGGFWSSAFFYRLGSDELVLRLGDTPDGFEIDAAAMAFNRPGLPVPEVVETGRALGVHFAVSRRHRGSFIEVASLEDADSVALALGSVLAGLRSVPSSSDAAVVWYEPPGRHQMSWRDWLRSGLVDDPARRVSGWRAKLDTQPRVKALFQNCESRIEELLPSCPERRDLVHGDLLHQNVLISDEDPSQVTAVFSWKCSVRGDFLFDVAWCTFWAAWLPPIAAAKCWEQTLAAGDLSEADWVDGALRHHCYELQIAASHIGWYLWTEDTRELNRLVEVTEPLLARGPLPERS